MKHDEIVWHVLISRAINLPLFRWSFTLFHMTEKTTTWVIKFIDKMTQSVARLLNCGIYVCFGKNNKSCELIPKLFLNNCFQEFVSKVNCSTNIYEFNFLNCDPNKLDLMFCVAHSREINSCDTPPNVETKKFWENFFKL